MTARIHVDELPEFDAAPYLDSEAVIVAYLSDILEANDPPCWRLLWATLAAQGA